MKRKNRISRLTLELYYRGLATYKERRLVEKALKTDSGVQRRYKAIQESDQEILKSFSQELRRLNIPETSLAPAPQRRKTVWGIIAAAAIFICALVPAFFYLKNSSSNKENEIAKGSNTKIETANNSIPVENITRTSGSAEDSYPEDKTETAAKPGAVKYTETQQKGTGKDKQIRGNADFQSGGVSIAAVPETDTGIRTRGGNNAGQQPDVTMPSEQESNLSIPPGITFIFENMFANRQLSVVVIPGRITSVGKNAFADNPLVSVTIGENVAVDDTAFPGNFANTYNNYGKAAGTYIRPNIDSETWIKK